MTVTVRRRLELFAAAKTSWGEEPAQTMMDLYPRDSDELATKADLLRLENRVLERMNEQTRLLVLSMISLTVTSVVSVVLTIAFA